MRPLRRIGIILLVLLAAAGITMGFSRLKKAAPTIEESLLWIDTVRRGEFVRYVRGVGTLVPKDEWWIPAPGEGRVEKLLIRPGKVIEPGDVILKLKDPVLERDVQDAEWQLAAAEAELLNLQARLKSDQLDREDALVTLQAELEVAQMSARRDKILFEQGVLSEHQRDTSQAKYEELQTRVDLAKRRVATTKEAHEAQLAAQRATIEQARSLLALRKRQLRDLQVSTSGTGILQQVLVEEGQQVVPGTPLAKVARPDELKAELRIAETQTRDIQIGQRVKVDTRNGIVKGVVAHVDPAVVEGTVEVEVTLEGELPKGARPDLSVEGVIETERIDEALFVGRPATARENSMVELFRLSPDGGTASRVQIRLGKSSVNAVEIIEGLEAGDRVILSDMSKWEHVDRVRLR